MTLPETATLQFAAARIVTDWTIIILLTLFGFLALAAILLVPVYRFIQREEEASREWTPDEMAGRRRVEPGSGDGRPGRAPSSEPHPPPDERAGV